MLNKKLDYVCITRRILALKKKHGKQVQQETVQQTLAHAGAAPVSGEVNEVPRDIIYTL